MAENISYSSFLYFIFLIIPVFFIMKNLKVDLINRSLVAMGRMVIQMGFVGIYLQYIFELNNPWVNAIYVLVMVTVAVATVASDIKFKEVKIYIVLFLSLIVPVFLTTVFFNVLLIKLDNPFEAKYLIPLTGMILGNSMNGIVVALGDFIKNLKKNQDEYIFLLALGAEKKEALRGYFSESISLSLRPNIALMTSIGIVSLPGMMTGQILGGTLPILAIKYQIAIMLIIFVTRFFSTYILLQLLSKFYFDKYSIFDSRF